MNSAWSGLTGVWWSHCGKQISIYKRKVHLLYLDSELNQAQATLGATDCSLNLTDKPCKHRLENDSCAPVDRHVSPQAVQVPSSVSSFHRAFRNKDICCKNLESLDLIPVHC